MSELTIPRYRSEYVTKIIKNDSLSLSQKADQIYRYDVYMLRRNRQGAISRGPLYDRDEIKNALIELMR